MIAAYLIHSDEKGELLNIDVTEAPKALPLARLKRPSFISEEPVAQDNEELWLNNTGYKYVGAVGRYAWVYQ